MKLTDKQRAMLETWDDVQLTLAWVGRDAGYVHALTEDQRQEIDKGLTDARLAEDIRRILGLDNG